MRSPNANPLQLNTVMWVASCTKLMTSICCLQLVSRGKLTLDDPVYSHIPELEHFKILESFDKEEKPVEVQHTKPITLRTLLTHTSGLTYDSLHPLLFAWLAYHGRAPGTGANLLQRYGAPLTFEPRQSWMYGPGIDYAGLLIERVTGLSLEEYMRQNLWEPLGIKDMTFRLSSRPDMRERMADISFRDEVSGKVGNMEGEDGVSGYGWRGDVELYGWRWSVHECGGVY
jgi:CubicO group peptidase (beta-lactamase class C family)